MPPLPTTLTCLLTCLDVPHYNNIMRATEESRRAKLGMVILLVTTPVFFISIFTHLRQGYLLPTVLNVFMVVLQIINIILIAYKKSIRPGLSINLFFWAVYFYVATSVGGEHGEYSLWALGLPMAAFVFLPLTRALLSSAAFFIGLLLLVTLGPQVIPMHVYTPSFFVRFAICFVILVFIFFQYEKTRLELFHSLLMRDERLEEEMRRSEETTRIAMNAMQAKGRFLASVSHEIRTPLTLITGMSDLAIREDDRARLSEYLAGINDSAQHLLLLINNVLDFTKMESETFKLENKPFHFPGLIEKVVKAFSVEFKQKGLSLAYSYDPVLPEWFLGDTIRIRQIITNLISNAIKFTKAGGVTLNIAPYQADRYGNEGPPGVVPVCIRVRDTGIGIPDDMMDKIFLPFEQVAYAGVSHSGVGLGLAISKGLVDLMGGTIRAKKEQDGGSVFEAVIPFIPVKEGVNPDTKEEKSEARRKPQYSILLVDDNPSIVKMLSVVLIKSRHTVSTAASGKEAINALKEKAFDVVLMDVEMPGMDGIETTLRIRGGEAGEKAAHVPVIALTAHALDAVDDQCLKAGIKGVIKKPFELFALEDEITKIIDVRG